MLHLVRDLGWKAEYILADRRYGQNTHCALIVWFENRPHFLDPGFLVDRPIALPSEEEQEIRTGFNRLILAPEAKPDRFSLYTVREGKKVYRLTYKMSPVDDGEFYKAWDESFHWDMMRYPLLTRTAGSRQIYLKDSRIQISSAEATERHNVSREELIGKIAAEFCIHPAVVARAVSILKDRGEIAASRR